MSDDKIDGMLAIGGAFDWITPVADLLRGFNTIEIEGDEQHCKRIEKQLKQQGITCRTQFIGDSWRVISRR